MKTMKNAIILALVLCVNVLFTACSDDAPQDTLVGKWQKIERSFKDVLEELDECEKKSVLELKSDNTFIDISFEEYLKGECVSLTNEGKWKENWRSSGRTYLR